MLHVQKENESAAVGRGMRPPTERAPMGITAKGVLLVLYPAKEGFGPVFLSP